MQLQSIVFPKKIRKHRYLRGALCLRQVVLLSFPLFHLAQLLLSTNRLAK